MSVSRPKLGPSKAAVLSEIERLVRRDLPGLRKLLRELPADELLHIKRCLEGRP